MSLMAAMGRPQLATGPQKCVLFGEKSPRFRQGKHGKKKKRKNERKDQMFSTIPVLGIRYLNLTRIHVSVTELALTAHILFFT